jgi:hypothetical protein
LRSSDREISIFQNSEASGNNKDGGMADSGSNKGRGMAESGNNEDWERLTAESMNRGNGQQRKQKGWRTADRGSNEDGTITDAGRPK